LFYSNDWPGRRTLILKHSAVITVCVNTEWFGHCRPVWQLMICLQCFDVGVTFPVFVLIDGCSYWVWLPVSSNMHCCRGTMHANVGFRPRPSLPIPLPYPFCSCMYRMCVFKPWPADHLRVVFGLY